MVSSAIPFSRQPELSVEMKSRSGRRPFRSGFRPLTLDLLIRLSPVGPVASVVPPVRARSSRLKPSWPIISHVVALGLLPALPIPSGRSDGTITWAAYIPVVMSPPSLTPHDVLIPVAVALPTPPVLLQLSVRNPAMSGRYVAVVMAGEVNKFPRHAVRCNKSPRAIVGRGSEPVALMGTIPGALEEEDINGHIGDDINIRSGYDHNRRRSGNTKKGR